MRNVMVTVWVITALLLIGCHKFSKESDAKESKASAVDSAVVYQSENLIIQKISPHIYQHVSFLNSREFGRVDCNGMIVVNEAEVVVFDTPANEESAEELIRYSSEQLRCTIVAVIPTHFHEDCVASLKTFQTNNIRVYASHKTIGLLNAQNKAFSKPVISFEDSLALPVGDKTVVARYFGEGHTRDNIIGYFPEDSTLFGGCLIKALGASKGNLADANVETWSATVNKLHQYYPEVKRVIPGHGKPGTAELLEYTVKLFE